jgi:hypothetical protein
MPTYNLRQLMAIATLDKEFNIYRPYRKQLFDRVFLPQ